MENKKHEKELLLHMLFGTMIFSVLLMAAAGLDLAAQTLLLAKHAVDRL